MSASKTSSKLLVCTACENDTDVEVLHPLLRVPICGACASAVASADKSILDGDSCSWCGLGHELFMCDGDKCGRSFCTDCVAGNFGVSQLNRLRALKKWRCYCCAPTKALQALQVEGDFSYFNIDRAYAALRPPNLAQVQTALGALMAALSPDERHFAELVKGSVCGRTITGTQLIGSYLTALDLAAVCRVSRGLRRLFQRQSLVPGLFRTPYHQEHHGRLFGHQVVALDEMARMENASADFGAMRGGIFADEPGLGKTITSLALIASTAGLRATPPAAFWDEADIAERWGGYEGRYRSLLGGLWGALNKSRVWRFASPGLQELRSNLESYCGTMKTFEARVRTIAAEELPRIVDRYTFLELLRQLMHKVKEGLDPRKRKLTKQRSRHSTAQQQRICYERMLCPSSATLIIVPLALLEHWYEQILRHLNLGYFTSDEERRGVVYLDGLGDIVDVEAPISKLQVADKPLEPVSFLSHYMIVVTTFERVLLEARKQHRLADEYARYSLLQIRWLRLIVDEGHELGQSSDDREKKRRRKREREEWYHEQEESQLGVKGKVDQSPQAPPQAPFQAASPAKAKAKAPSIRRVRAAKYVQEDASSPVMTLTAFISTIAAERRWVMSGTPTTGSNSEQALKQLYRLLQFLRHPRILEGAPGSSGSGGSGSSGNSSSGSSVEEGASVAAVVSGASGPVAGTTAVRRTDFPPAPASAPAPVPAPGSTSRAPVPAHTFVDLTLSVSDGDTESSASSAPASAPTLRNSTRPQCKKSPLEWLTPQAWHKHVLVPCLGQDEEAWGVVVELLRSVMLRHTKADVHLYAPIHSSVMLAPVVDPLGPEAQEEEVQARLKSQDLAKALYIQQTMRTAREKWSAFIGHPGSHTGRTGVGSALAVALAGRSGADLSSHELDRLLHSRRPKAIIFCEDFDQIQGVTYQCLSLLGSGAVCEHLGQYQSSELSRFRHSQRKYRTCPMCGYQNQVSEGNTCCNVLYMVEYYMDPNPTVPAFENHSQSQSQSHFPASSHTPMHPQPAGGGALRGGGHYVGCCLCSPEGCEVLGTDGCAGRPNPFYGGPAERGAYADPHYALVRREDIRCDDIGKRFFLNEEVYVLPAEAYGCGGCGERECADCGPAQGQGAAGAAADAGANAPHKPLLWRGGRRGGHARVRMWKSCGGRNFYKSWCGSKQLDRVPWHVEEEDASLLFMQEEGSTGLDLSFATHIFLLDVVSDPALRSQIISRAHRIGATAPVQVHLVQVREEGQEERGQTKTSSSSSSSSDV